MASKRKSYRIEEKLDIIKRVKLDFNSNLSKASREFNIDRKVLRNRCQKEDVMMNMESKRSSRRLSGAGRRPQLPELENRLFAWFQQKRQEKIIVNYKKLREHASLLKTEMQIDTDCKFSDRWITNFCVRHGIR